MAQIRNPARGPDAGKTACLRYAFTLHDGAGGRLMGFDNAHRVSDKGARYARRVDEYDHWHQTGDGPGKTYNFTSAAQLLTDFFAEARRVLDERGIDDTVIGETDTSRRR